MEVRQAGPGDVDAACAALAAAFSDYGWTRWTVDADDHARRVEALQRLALTELSMPFGEAWVATDDGAIVSVAMWMRPDLTVPQDVLERLAARQAELEGGRHEASFGAEAAMAPFRTNDPHYFLGAVGTVPSAQRRGFGAAVLQPVLDRLESENAIAYLETCGEPNVAFYRGLGFEIVHEVSLPDGAPTVWVMRRG